MTYDEVRILIHYYAAKLADSTLSYDGTLQLLATLNKYRAELQTAWEKRR